MPKLYTSFLVLENGFKCQGWSFVDSSQTCGEVVFNTAMTGYQEVVTDPSYCDQIIVFTYPEIGNTGVNTFDLESNCARVKGLVMKKLCLNPSSWMCKMSLPEYLVKHRVPHIFGVDTRYLTKQLRSLGVMVGSIASTILSPGSVKLEFVKFKTSQDFQQVSKVTTQKSYSWLFKESNAIRYKLPGKLSCRKNNLSVIVVDYGVKFNILNRLKSYGCSLSIVPAHTSYICIALQKPDGILLSNGPGDPSMISYAIKNIQGMLSLNIPIFGICLGHQLLSLALGANTVKLKFGHRGLNHPISSLNNNGLVKITSQNHGYVVQNVARDISSLTVLCLNLNDKTVAGLVHNFKPCFSVQYHPEASPGPSDSDYLFYHFVVIMLLCKY